MLRSAGSSPNPRASSENALDSSRDRPVSDTGTISSTTSWGTGTILPAIPDKLVSGVGTIVPAIPDRLVSGTGSTPSDMSGTVIVSLICSVASWERPAGKPKEVGGMCAEYINSAGLEPEASQYSLG